LPVLSVADCYLAQLGQWRREAGPQLQNFAFDRSQLRIQRHRTSRRAP
jgi:hypothetical protein